MNKKGLLLLAFFGCLLVFFAGQGEAADYTLKVGYVVPETYPHHIAARDVLKPYIEENSGGKIKVELYPAGQLGGDRQLCESIQLGTLEMAFPSTTYLGSFIRKMQLLDLPYLFKSKEDVYKVLDGEIGEMLAQEARKQGFYLFGFADIGFMHLTNSVRPINKPEDAEGLKIRIQENPVYIDTGNAIGYNPTPLAFGEVYTALQQNVVDGQEQGINVIRNMKFFEVQKYLSLTGEAYSTISIIVSESFYDSLDAELQVVVKEGVNRFCKAQREINSQQEETNFEELKAKGMIINEISEESRAFFVEATEPVRQKYSEKIDPDLYKAILETVK